MQDPKTPTSQTPDLNKRGLCSCRKCMIRNGNKLQFSTYACVKCDLTLKTYGTPLCTSTKLMKYSGQPGDKQIKFGELEEVTQTRSMIAQQSERQMHQLVCITMYNEPYIQILQSLAGIYRNYFELLEVNQKYQDKLSIVIVCDGYPVFTKDDLTKDQLANWQRYEKAGIYKHKKTRDFWSKRNRSAKECAKNISKYEYSQVPAIGKLENDEAQFEEVSFETQNLAHCFSRAMKFENFLDGLTHSEQMGFKIDGIGIRDFLFGNEKEGKLRSWKYREPT